MADRANFHPSTTDPSFPVAEARPCFQASSRIVLDEGGIPRDPRTFRTGRQRHPQGGMRATGRWATGRTGKQTQRRGRTRHRAGFRKSKRAVCSPPSGCIPGFAGGCCTHAACAISQAQHFSVVVARLLRYGFRMVQLMHADMPFAQTGEDHIHDIPAADISCCFPARRSLLLNLERSCRCRVTVRPQSPRGGPKAVLVR